MKLEHFHSDMGTNSNIHNTEPYHEKPSAQTVRIAIELGRVAVGEADIICQDKKYIVVIKRVSNGFSGNIYRDMYRIIN